MPFYRDDSPHQPGARTAPPSGVPARQVILSAAALWLCYFALITVRGLIADLGDFNELLWRRALVTLVGIIITVATWPLLRRFETRPLITRAIAALFIMFPAALLIAYANQLAFAPVEQRILTRIAEQQQASRDATGQEPGIEIRQDMAGNVLVDVLDQNMVPAPPVPPAPPELPAQPAVPPAPPVPGISVEKREDGSAEVRVGPLVVRKDAPAPSPSAPARQAEAPPAAHVTVIQKNVEKEGLWRQLTDVALGRYFLLLAWAALYLALGNAAQVQAAERREGEFKRAAKAAELRSLRYQVNPHFLFNTLNSLSALVMSGRAEEAERMIQTMSSFYRNSLAGDPTADVPLADEIALQRHYLDIEAVRFPERLRTEFAVPDDLASACVPGMILQPLVENSVKYGVSATSRPVTIRIAARLEADRLILTVSDDGPGKPDGVDGTGIGLANVRDRLAARFGREASVESGPLPGGGYATTLSIPVIRHAC